MDKWAPGAHFSQYLFSLVMVGHVKVSVHCCVCADKCAARVNEGCHQKSRKKNHVTLNTKNNTFHAFTISKLRVDYRSTFCMY